MVNQPLNPGAEVSGVDRCETTLAQDAAALTFRTSTPHPVLDTIHECVLQALVSDGATFADLLGDLDAYPIAREKRLRRLVRAIALSHPQCAHVTLLVLYPGITHRLCRKFP